MASASYFSLWDVEQLKAAIFNAYSQTGAGTQACLELNTAMQSMTPTQIYNMCESLDSTNMITNSLAQVYPTAGNATIANAVNVSSSFAQGEAAAIEAAAGINSNTAAAAARSASMQIPANFSQAGGVTSVKAGAEVAEGASAGTTVPTALGHAATAIVGTAIGLKLGVWIDGIAYELAPDFWDSHNLSEVNPETWNDSIIGNGLLQWADYPQVPVMMDSDGQMYADQEYFALMAQYLNSQGAFRGDQQTDPSGIDSGKFYNSYNFTDNLRNSARSITAADNCTWLITGSGSDVFGMFYSLYDDVATGNIALFASDQTFAGTWYLGEQELPISPIQATAKDGSTVYYYAMSWDLGSAYNPPVNLVDCTHFDNVDAANIDMAYALINGVTTGQSEIPGVNQFDTVPEGITDDMSIADILDLLRDQYPELFADSIKTGVLQPDGTITNKYYLPIGWPEGGTDTQPTSRPENAGAIDPENEGQTRRAGMSTRPGDTDGKTGDGGDTGKGTTPTLVAPTGSADALYAIYNPTDAQVRSLGAWLWSPNFVDQILKMFSNPMEAIISLHKIYGTPHTATNPQNIKVGYLDSGVSSKVVDKQYITIDCGSVNVYEHYANVFDYTPYTEINLYLPFIGIVQLDVADIMRGKCKVIYHIDVITGAILAEVNITRDNGAGGVIYQYTGSCAEHYPLSAGSYMGIVTGAAGITAGVVGTVMSGGALAPMLLGGAAAIGSMHTNVQKSGGFSANAGAMGIKKPYFIISRPQSAMSNMWQHFSGMGANTYCKLASCKGFTRVKFIHLDNVQGACKEDLDAIEAALKQGVIV